MPRLAHQNPGLLADLGVGLWAWPLPMDYNGDGLMDLVVVCTDKPYNGTWFFENSGVVKMTAISDKSSCERCLLVCENFE